MREERDAIEREFKITPAAGVDDDAVLRIVREAVSAEHVIVAGHARTILDLYLDDHERTLLAHGATLRLRSRRSGKWRANFKPPTDPALDYMSRREVRTNLSRREAVHFSTDTELGLAISLAREFLGSCTGSAHPSMAPLSAPLLLVTARRFYSVTTTDVAADGLRPFPGLVYVVFDAVRVLDATSIDAETLLRTGCYDATDPVAASSFQQIELEVSGGSGLGLEDEALALGRHILERLVEAGCQPAHRTKYQDASRLLATATVA